MISKLSRFVVCLLFTLVCLEPTISLAGTTKKKIQAQPTRGVISSFSLADKTITFTVSPKATPKTLSYTSESTLEIDGKSYTFDQVRVGMEVRSVRLSDDSTPTIEDLDLVNQRK